MKFIKKYWYFLFVTIVTLGLGVVSYLTSQKLSQKTPVAPTVPQVTPKAAEPACTLKFTILSPPPAPVCPTAKSFSDVSSSSSYFDAVTNLSGSPCCTIAGNANGMLLPDSIISRAEAVVFMANYHVFVVKDWAWVIPAQASFTDVPLNHWAYAQIETAKSKGFIVGIDNGNGTKSFKPNDQWKWGLCGITKPCSAETDAMTRGQYIQKLYDFGKSNNQINACLPPTPTATPTPTPTPVQNKAPNCTGLSVSPNSGTKVPLKVTITCSGSDPGGYLNAVEFTFGDGSSDAIEKNLGSPGSLTAKHSFAQFGTYEVTCRVRDNDNVYSSESDACRKTITITERTGGTQTIIIRPTEKPLPTATPTATPTPTPTEEIVLAPTATPTPLPPAFTPTASPSPTEAPRPKVPVAGTGPSVLGISTIAGGLLLILLGLIL